MRKSIVALVIFSFLIVAVLGTAPAFGADTTAPVIKKDYPSMSAPVSYKYVDPDGANWDLTRGDLTVSYTMDMSNYAPKAEENTETSMVGIWGSPGIPFGWMSSCAPGAYTQNSEIFNQNDKFFLTWPVLDRAEGDYGAYIASGKSNDWANIQLVDNNWFPPWWSWGKGLGDNYGFYFDRGQANTDKATNWGLEKGKTIETGGKYDVSITYHALGANNGVMFATINGVQQGFFGTSPLTGKPQYMPVGKLFNGAQDWVQVFVELNGAGVNIYNFKATGSPRVPAVVGVDPGFGLQGDNLDPRVNGESFRDVGIAVNFLKANATGDGDAVPVEAFAADPVTYLLNSWGHTVLAHLKIPDDATPGPWNVTYKHSDDPVVARMNNAFTVTAPPPEITSVSVNHAKRKQTVHMKINGKFFRNPRAGITVQLKRYNEMINGTNIKWKSKILVEADFTIPSTATIGADWSVFVQHNDDKRSSTQDYWFSVDAPLNISPHVIWQHAPWYLSVQILSETGFDATTVNPMSVSMGGIIPYWYQLKDMNRDGKKDIELRFWNSFVTIPVGFNRTVAVAARTSSWVPIKAYDTVNCFWFLF